MFSLFLLVYKAIAVCAAEVRTFKVVAIMESTWKTKGILWEKLQTAAEKEPTRWLTHGSLEN